ncbi:mitochondrial coenzyme A diphosphatase NUDT8 [Neocloeon triangulifer]|uniref:mitochondrial coenzyme A diphosphatase NUDT8 n=1 Tax=Neocloeon triangulifer TaxID=2078957 RepID=UPI00286F1BB5|nr:mitochondrial coenzyme A diphosphatase NUDT8 [Neocloeon triangulifer]
MRLLRAGHLGGTLLLVSQRSVHLDATSVIGQENRIRCVQALRQIKPLRLKGGEPEKKAAVLVPLCIVEGQLSLLYTVRSTNLRTNRGEVSFPGGMEDSTDSSLVETALRETEEELGIKASTVDVWSEANFVGTYSGKVAVMPVLGFVGTLDLKNLQVNDQEVEAVFSLSIEQLCDPLVCRHTQFRSRGMVLPVFQAPGQQTVWGLTAVISHIMLKALVPKLYKKHLRAIPAIKVEEPKL